MDDHYFVIEGSKKDGNYTIKEYKADGLIYTHKIIGNKQSGVKECRIWIGNHIKSIYSNNDKRIKHIRIYPGKFPNIQQFNWTVDQYLLGVLEEKTSNVRRSGLIRYSIEREKDV